eukprot:jgi/Picre1/31128/NNA_006482.t1
MIMSKFQELEEIQRREEKSKELEENGETNKDEDHQLTDDQLLQVFKQTRCMGKMTSSLMMRICYGPFGRMTMTGKKQSIKKGSRSRGKKPARQKLSSKVRHRVVTAYNPSTQALVRRRIKVADPNAIQFIRIPPPPIPLSWGRVIAPYTPPKQERTAVVSRLQI